MSRRTPPQTEAPGQDSFLDVVANLVGVMIILVMVVGTQAKHAITSMGATSASSPELVPELEAAVRDLTAETAALRDLESKLQQQEMEIAFRRGERDQSLKLCSTAKVYLQEKKAHLTEEERREVELKTAVSSTQQELESLDQALVAMTGGETKTEVVKHYPTPIAKTVFGQEVHFRLQNGRLTYVPFEEFVKMLKDDAPKRIWKLKDADRLVETLGPLHGFHMRYALVREQVSTGAGGHHGERASLEQFVLLPTQDNLGESITEALGPQSDFHTALKQYDPKRCTVTLWVYTESFQHFRTIRDDLLKLGFVTAGRPMPEGHPIGGSPEGSRSAAQ